MAVSYLKLWHLLLDRNMKKKELQAAAKLSSATMSKLRHGQNVTTDILVRVCGVLECRVEDIMEILPEDATVTGVEDDHE